jgi:hypothetical protein
VRKKIYTIFLSINRQFCCFGCNDIFYNRKQYFDFSLKEKYPSLGLYRCKEVEFCSICNNSAVWENYFLFCFQFWAVKKIIFSAVFILWLSGKLFSPLFQNPERQEKSLSALFSFRNCPENYFLRCFQLYSAEKIIFSSVFNRILPGKLFSFRFQNFIRQEKLLSCLFSIVFCPENYFPRYRNTGVRNITVILVYNKIRININ